MCNISFCQLEQYKGTYSFTACRKITCTLPLSLVFLLHQIQNGVTIAAKYDIIERLLKNIQLRVFLETI